MYESRFALRKTKDESFATLTTNRGFRRYEIRTVRYAYYEELIARFARYEIRTVRYAHYESRFALLTARCASY